MMSVSHACPNELCIPFDLSHMQRLLQFCSRLTELALPEHTLDTHNGNGVTLISRQLYKTFSLCLDCVY